MTTASHPLSLAVPLSTGHVLYYIVEYCSSLKVLRITPNLMLPVCLYQTGCDRKHGDLYLSTGLCLVLSNVVKRGVSFEIRHQAPVPRSKFVVV